MAARANSVAVPFGEKNEPRWQGIGYQLGGVRLVSSMGELLEVLKVRRYTPVPRVREWMLGIANIRGRLIPIIDLHVSSVLNKRCRKLWRECWWSKQACVVLPQEEPSQLVPNDCVAEILPWRRVKPMPGMPRWCLGTLVWRGQTVVVVDFSCLPTTAHSRA